MSLIHTLELGSHLFVCTHYYVSIIHQTCQAADNIGFLPELTVTIIKKLV